MEGERVMARSGTTVTRVLGLIFLVGGIGVAYWGYQMSGSITARVTHTFTGSYSDEVMLRFIGGAIGCVVGLFLLLKK